MTTIGWLPSADPDTRDAHEQAATERRAVEAARADLLAALTRLDPNRLTVADCDVVAVLAGRFADQARIAVDAARYATLLTTSVRGAA